MPSDALTISCPAKINLALSVGAPREDGMHPICSWMVVVDFADSLTLAKSEDGECAFNIYWAEDAPLPQQVDWPIESDLAFRAHALMEEHVGRALPIKADLCKYIPAGAGLGGGSANAAGMLVGLNRLFDLRLSEAALAGLGLKLGADVVFMLLTHTGQQSAMVTGIGEILEPHTLRHGIEYVLILPEVSCPTARVYKAFDLSGQTSAVDIERVQMMMADEGVTNDAPFNDLTDAAFELQPDLRRVWDRVKAVAEHPVHLSGSGSAMFLVVSSQEEGQTIANQLVERAGVVAIAVRTPPK